MRMFASSFTRLVQFSFIIYNLIIDFNLKQKSLAFISFNAWLTNSILFNFLFPTIFLSYFPFKNSYLLLGPSYWLWISTACSASTMWRPIKQKHSHTPTLYYVYNNLLWPNNPVCYAKGFGPIGYGFGTTLTSDVDRLDKG